MAEHSHSVVHIEIPAKDTKAAGKFYGELFGWNIHTDPSFDYTMFAPKEGPGGGFVNIGGTPMANLTYKADSLLVYVSTDDIDATLAKAESLGAKKVLGKTDIPGVGWFAVFTDPSGNNVALYTGLPH